MKLSTDDKLCIFWGCVAAILFALYLIRVL